MGNRICLGAAETAQDVAIPLNNKTEVVKLAEEISSDISRQRFPILHTLGRRVENEEAGWLDGW